MTLSVSTSLALFTPKDFSQVNQLADLLFDETINALHLISEHESVTYNWIMSALTQSCLAKKAHRLPKLLMNTDASNDTDKHETWLYQGQGKLIKASASETNPSVTLSLPPLNTALRIQLLHQLAIDHLETAIFTIPISIVQQALEWQSRYCRDENLIQETWTLLHRATKRFHLRQDNTQKASSLTANELIEVLVDWQELDPNYLTLTELKAFLSEQLIGQNLAIEHFCAQLDKRFFILAGPKYSGKQSFISAHAAFTLGAKNFYIPFNLSDFPEDIPWESILLPKPFQRGSAYQRLIDIVQNYPSISIVLTEPKENIPLLMRLVREINRGFFQIHDQCISLKSIRFMVILETTTAPHTESIIQESIFNADKASALSDILYQANVKISMENDMPSVENKFDSMRDIEKYLPSAILSSACVLIFSDLSEKNKRSIITKEMNRIIHDLRSSHGLSLYYQEEVIDFLLNQIHEAQEGFQALHENLYRHIENIFLNALKEGMILEGQILMLQLNDTGRFLHIVKTQAKGPTTQIKFSVK